MAETVKSFDAEEVGEPADADRVSGDRLRPSEERLGELMRTVERLEGEIDDLLTIGGVAQSIATAPSIERALAEILDRIRRLLRADRIILGLVNHKLGYEEVKLALGVPAADLRGSRWPIGDSDPIWRRLLDEPHLPATLRGDEAGLPDYARAAFPAGFLKSPMIAKGEIVGTIMVSTTRSGPSARDLRLLGILVGHASLAVENGRLNYDVIKSEEKLVRIHEELLEAQSLAAVGQLAVSINHEINNPLCTINMSAQLLRADLERRAPELVGRLDGIEQAAQRILEVTRKVSEMNKVRSTEYLPNQMMIDLR